MTTVVAFVFFFLTVTATVGSVSVEKSLHYSTHLNRNNQVIVVGATSRLRDDRNVQCSVNPFSILLLRVSTDGV